MYSSCTIFISLFKDKYINYSNLVRKVVAESNCSRQLGMNGAEMIGQVCNVTSSESCRYLAMEKTGKTRNLPPG